MLGVVRSVTWTPVHSKRGEMSTPLAPSPSDILNGFQCVDPLPRQVEVSKRRYLGVVCPFQSIFHFFLSDFIRTSEVLLYFFELPILCNLPRGI